MKIYFAAAGRVGQALGKLLLASGHEGVGLWSRSEETARAASTFLGLQGGFGALPTEALARAEVVLLSPPERAVEPLARAIAPQLRRGALVLHTAGSLPPVEGLPEGISSGVMHPLQSIATPEAGLRSLPGAYFAISGDEVARRIAARLVEDIGGTPVRVESQLFYHLGAVLASNTLYPLFDAALRLMARAGIPEEQARSMLLPLVRGSVENLARLSPAQGMTGPIARADAGTVSRHLEALEDEPEIRAIYLALGRRAVELARSAGAEERGLDAIDALLAEHE